MPALPRRTHRAISPNCSLTCRPGIGGRQRQRAIAQPWEQRFSSDSAVAPNDDNLGLPEVSGNHGQAVASLVANSGEPPAHGNNNHSIPGDAGEHGSNPSHGAPSNAHAMSGGGNAPSHSHGNNGPQANPTIALNDDNLAAPEVSGNHGQAVASLVANSGEPPTHGNNNHSIPGDAGEHGSNPSHGAPSNAHAMSGGGNAPSHSHGNNGPQANPTIALNDDNLERRRFRESRASGCEPDREFGGAAGPQQQQSFDRERRQRTRR